MAKLFLTYTNPEASQTAAQTKSSANTYSVIFDEGRKSIWAQGKEYGYISDTVTYASYVTTGDGKNLVAGTNVTLTNDNGSVTIASAYTNTTNVTIAGSGSGNYVSGVSMTNSGNSGSAHAITITYSTLPTLSLAKETDTTTLAHGGKFTYDVVTSASGHQLTYTRVTATLPSETQLSGGATAEDGKYVSAVTVSGHAVTVTKATLPTIGNGSIYAYIGRSHASSSGTLLGTANQTTNTSTYITAEDLGITGVMNFLGVVTSVPTSSTVTIAGKQVTAVKGDVVVVNDTAKEYLHSGTGTNPWIELGDETSFALKSTTISSNSTTDGITATLGGTINTPTITLSGTPITNAINALDANFSYTNTTTSFISYSLTETDGKITAFTVNHDKLIDEINAKEAVTAAALTDINSSLNASVSSQSTVSGITATLGGTVKSPTITLSGSTPNTVTYVKADTTSGTGVATGVTITGSGTNPLTYTVKLTYTSLATTSGTSTTISSSNNKVLTNISQAANGKITYSYGSLPATAFSDTTDNTVSGNSGSNAAVTYATGVTAIAAATSQVITNVTLTATGLTYTYAKLPDNAFKDTTANENITFTASGDVSGNASGTTSLSPTLTIGDGKVTNVKLANSSITIVDKSVALGGTMEPADFWGTL